MGKPSCANVCNTTFDESLSEALRVFLAEWISTAVLTAAFYATFLKSVYESSILSVFLCPPIKFGTSRVNFIKLCMKSTQAVTVLSIGHSVCTYGPSVLARQM